MTIMRISEIVHNRTGWCPNARAMRARTPCIREGGGPAGFPDPQEPQPGSTIDGAIVIPRWFTAVSIIVLPATLFFGGNIWWPVLVFGIIVIGMAVTFRPDLLARRG